MSKEFREEFAAMVSESEVTDYQDSQNQSLTEKFTYPVYDITFTTGANEDTCLWKMIFFQTDTHTYAYAFKMDADSAEYMEEEYWNAVNSLELIDISYNQTEETDYDPSANGESLDGYGELMLTPVIPGYGSIYSDAAFIRASESVAYEAQPTGDGYGDYIPEEENSYEEDGMGDYIPYDYEEWSDPGETYYWYDGEGSIMYFDGCDNTYVGPADVYYIDDAGRLCMF